MTAQELFKLCKISTHTLTWSVTIGTHAAGVAVTDFNSHAHVERDKCLLPKVRKY